MDQPGSRPSFEACFSELWVPVLRFTTHRVGHAHAEEVAQKVFIVVHRRWKDAPSSPEHLRYWVFGVARRVVANQFRSGRRLKQLEEKLKRAKVADHDSAESEAEVRMLAQRIVLAAEQRSPEDAELVLLLAEEYSTPEIAAILGISEAAANSRIFRLRKHLRMEADDRSHEGEAEL